MRAYVQSTARWAQIGKAFASRQQVVQAVVLSNGAPPQLKLPLSHACMNHREFNEVFDAAEGRGAA